MSKRSRKIKELARDFKRFRDDAKRDHDAFGLPELPAKKKEVLWAKSPAILLRKPRHLYWAYGSNLNKRAMKERCPGAKKSNKLYVPEGLLVFRGVADVEATHDPNNAVPGGLWWITDACERALDRYEGVSGGLYVKRYLTLEVDGKVRRALFYKMTSNGIMPPWESYLNTIAQGYEDFDLDLAYLSDAVERSHNNKDKTPDLIRRWENKGRPSLAKALADSEVSAP